MYNLIGLFGRRRIVRAPNAPFREEMNGSFLRWFEHIQGMDKGRITRKAYLGECIGYNPVGQPGNGGLIQ